MDIRPPTDLKAATEARRLELGKKWKDVLAETGLSYQTLNVWRKGRKVDPLTERKFERALGWAPGARDAIEAGEEPKYLSGGAAGARVEAAQQAVAAADEADPVMRAMRAMLEGNSPEAAADILSRVVDGFPPEERDGIWRRLLGQAPLDGAESQRRVG